MAKKKIRVLVVDDQALVLDILAKGLVRDSAIEVAGTATDGFIALNEVSRLKPDVIVLDLEMPRMNGIQFLHKLMPFNPIPTIVLSALTERDSKLTSDAFEAGAVDFLPKPSGGARELPKLLVQLWTKIKVAASQDVSHLRKAVKPKTMPKTALDRTVKSKNIVLGMGAFDVIDDPARILKIFALGSCVGVGLFCKSNSVVGLAHVVLPSSATDKEKARSLPGYFADTAIPAMLEKMHSLGCKRGDIYAKIAGGAKTKVELGDYFSVGQRNGVSVKANLLRNGIKILAEDIGGNISRTVALKPGNNKMELSYPERGIWEI